MLLRAEALPLMYLIWEPAGRCLAPASLTFMVSLAQRLFLGHNVAI